MPKPPIVEAYADPELETAAAAVDAARATFLASPSDAAAQAAYSAAIERMRSAQSAANVAAESVIGSSYPRTSGRKPYSQAQICGAIEFVVANYGAHRVDWDRLSRDAFHISDSSFGPAWAGASIYPAVQIGQETRVDDWRRPRVEGSEVRRPDAPDIAIPLRNLDKRGIQINVVSGNGTSLGIISFNEHGFVVLPSVVDVFLPNHALYAERRVHFKEADRLLREELRANPSLTQTLSLSTLQAEALLSGKRNWKTIDPQRHLTWHHHEDVGRMQLVARIAHDHSEGRHLGGYALWGLDERNITKYRNEPYKRRIIRLTKTRSGPR